MRITVNGTEEELDGPMTLAGLIAKRGTDKVLLSVEWNFTLPSRQQWDTIELKDGDNVEFIRFIGGG